MRPTTDARRGTAWNPLEVLDTEMAKDTDEPTDSVEAYLIFQLRGQWLAANVAQVREILDDQPLTSLPNAPHDVEGMIDVRGTGVTVVDIAQHLGIRDPAGHAPERIVVFEFERADRAPLAIGVRTETVRDVCQIPGTSIEPIPEALNDWDQSMILGVTRLEQRIVVLIDLSGIVGSERLAADAFDFA